MKIWRVGGIDMTYPVIIAAGVCKTPASIDAYQHPDLPIGAVVSGSYTKEARTGNTGTLSAWIPEKESGVNAYGMPNCGFGEAYRAFSAKPASRPLILSIAGFSPMEYLIGRATFTNKPMENIISAIELNLGCPNAHDRKTLPMSYDITSLRELLTLCRDMKTTTPVWLKLSPFLLQIEVDELSEHVDVRGVPVVGSQYLGEIAELIGEYGDVVRAVVNCNTIPNCRYKDGDGKYVTTPNDGQAGLSGALLKSVALRQAREMRYLLPRAIDVIGCGGILTGSDAKEYFDAGVAAIQIASLPYWHGGAKAAAGLIADSEALQNFLVQS